MTTNAGRFVWHDLMTTNVKAAQAFYSELFGWVTREVNMGSMGSYIMISVNGRDIGGMVPLDSQKGAPSHWIGYLTVENVDEATQETTAAGGNVVIPGTNIPSIGRFAVIADPQGAYVSPFAPENPPPPESDSPPTFGTFCWDELWTTDTDASSDFYGNLAGWDIEELPMPGNAYFIFKRGDQQAAGMTEVPQPRTTPFWLAYVAVNDVDEAAARAQKLGATQTLPPTDVPNIGRFAVLNDPTGAAVALFQSAR
jgi:predicted enzyme related to lactoylglutathione lyase